MGAELRAVRRRIRSVRSTMKITRAMELIAASQIRRAQARVKESRPYAELITRAIGDLTGQSESIEHPLLEVRERPVEKTWSGFSERPSYDAAKDIADTLIQAFLDREVDEIFGVYTDFVSALTQRAEARRFIPLVVEEVEVEEEGPYPLYIFEPSATEILDSLLPRYVETRVFAALLESAASEHAARQRAMKAATDNAEELIKSLTRVANQARQAEITTEIMEIVGGAEALAAEALQKAGVG